MIDPLKHANVLHVRIALALNPLFSTISVIPGPYHPDKLFSSLAKATWRFGYIPPKMSQMMASQFRPPVLETVFSRIAVHTVLCSEHLARMRSVALRLRIANNPNSLSSKTFDEDGVKVVPCPEYTSQSG